MLLAGIFLFLGGTPLHAQSDAAAQAPWQAYPGTQSDGNFAGYERAAGPMEPIAEPPAYEGIGQFPGENRGDCESCGDEGPCPDVCASRDCLNPFVDRLWFSGEYLTWWDKAGNLPPLGTTSTAGTPREEAGVLGHASTSTINGGRAFEMGLRSGARLSLGCWANACRDEGIEATFLFLGSVKTSSLQTSDEYSILARPFYNARTFRQDAVIVAFSQQQTGWLNADITNELSSLSMLYRKVVVRGCSGQLDFVAGYRYARFTENLAVDSSTTYIATVGDIAVGTVIDVSDWFGAYNEFHGGEVGISAKNRYQRWSFEVLAKLALGGTRSRTRVEGSTTVAVLQQEPVTYNDGMLALPTNSRTYEETCFSAMPELGLNIGYDLTPRLKATVGYTFLYWSSVARPADQIDTSLNPTQFPPHTRIGYPAPEAKFILTDYWAQGLNFGLDYRF